MYDPESNLRQLVNRLGPLDYERAARYVEEVARQLAELHLSGDLHSDIRPANILIDRFGAARLLPLTSIPEDDDSLVAEAEDIVGYLAPERALSGRTADGRADIYSLGCVLYFLLAGQTPFPSGTISERLLMHQISKPVSISELRSDVPRSLIHICEKMMAKQPKDRYQTANELFAAIEDWRGSAN